MLIGKHPMAPTISPKKSWEGMAGSVLACMLVATPIIVLGLDGPWWGGLLFGAALAATATLGDLAESLIKRDLGIKDMGNLLPGHGGLMDRLDSLLPSAAVAYLLLAVLAPVYSRRPIRGPGGADHLEAAPGVPVPRPVVGRRLEDDEIAAGSVARPSARARTASPWPRRGRPGRSAPSRRRRSRRLPAAGRRPRPAPPRGRRCRAHAPRGR